MLTRLRHAACSVYRPLSGETRKTFAQIEFFYGPATLPHLGSLGALLDQLTGCQNANRAVRDEVAPHPMVMSDYAGCIQVRPIVQRVTVANNNDVVIV